MSAQAPACQLLERQKDNYASLWVVGPPVDSWLIDQSTGVVSGDFDALHEWQANGKQARTPFDLAADEPFGKEVVLFWPKAHQLGIWWLKWLCEQLPEGTPIEIVGEHQGGIKRVPKILDELGMPWDKRDNARRCSLFATHTVALDSSSDTAWQTFETLDLTLASHPGVFGHGKVDEGTLLLLESLESSLPKKPLKVLDMGCGDGIISAWLAQRGHQVTAVDVSAFAVEACKRTLAANGLEGRVLCSDVFSALEGEQFDWVVSNPPFHKERDISYGPSQRLISQAPEHLNTGGRLIIVANGFLPYPDHLQRAFQDFQTLADNRRFKVYGAVKTQR
ncbi:MULTISPECIES: methyltransferase [unclassified Halomonas]|uniref:methyltransferase n=1 Tax=unclassified Halomonas TaxID=2609666 RepID=UPI0007D94A4F|nr:MULTISPECIES: methyltransferase [unclassified Halomonas]MBT2787385.1 methyltransferase [Halomonas sp. ISL-106]MBT2796253.1 methyltransferase [Halomonas sp. ISL-104]OAL57596.1 16S rRNA methyltransferase [Halomonas sp. ALS9]